MDNVFIRNKVIYCLQCKTKWVDGDSWWHTEVTRESVSALEKEHLPNLKQHNKEKQAKDSSPEYGIEGFEYRIVIQIVVKENL